VIYKVLRKQDAFYSVFHELASLANQAADELLRLFGSLPITEADAATISDFETKGDRLIVDLNLKLANAFITPIDREDIHRLASGLDGVLDALHGSAHRAIYFRVEKAPEDALEMLRLAKTAITALGSALSCLQTGASPAEFRETVKSCEQRSDELCRRAIGRMFEERVEIYELLKWKELYERLESLLDRCEDFFHTLETLVVKYA